MLTEDGAEVAARRTMLLATAEPVAEAERSLRRQASKEAETSRVAKIARLGEDTAASVAMEGKSEEARVSGDEHSDKEPEHVEALINVEDDGSARGGGCDFEGPRGRRG